MSFLNKQELKKIPFKKLGENVKISSKASFYGVENIEIGDNVRIDDFCVLSAGDGGIEIGRHVHIAVYSSIIGNAKVKLCDFSGLSSKVSIYSSSDDYSGVYLTNPTVPDDYTNVQHGDVFIGKHVIVGACSVILPNVSISEGVAVGAHSLVTKSLDSWFIYSGVPVKRLKSRKKDLLELEKKLIKGFI